MRASGKQYYSIESLRNCLYYDTEIENMYLKGDFVLDDSLCIVQKPVKIPVTDSLNECGYPFFYGEAVYRGTFKGVADALTVERGYAAADIEINGHKKELLLSDTVDISGMTTDGINTVKITLKTSLRNLLGPHHQRGGRDETGVFPYTFTMRGSWNGKLSADYTKEYNTVKFGLKSCSCIIYCLEKTTPL